MSEAFKRVNKGFFVWRRGDFHLQIRHARCKKKKWRWVSGGVYTQFLQNLLSRVDQGLDREAEYFPKIRFRGYEYRIKLVQINVSLPSILIPGFDLRVGELQFRRQLHSVLHAEVLLSLETLFQSLQLMVREGRSCFSLLFTLRRAQWIRALWVVVFSTWWIEKKKKINLLGNKTNFHK